MLNIPRQIYVGLDTKSTVENLSIGEVVPDSNEKNIDGKLAALTNKGFNVKEFDNIPLPGFTLYGNIYKSSDTHWQIIDPRGFIAKISSQNLSDILKVTGITEGLIQQKCVWVRNDDDLKVRLLPISSSSYNQVLSNTELIENKVDIANVDIGDLVLLRNGFSGIYRGVMTLYGTLDAPYNGLDLRPKIIQKKQVVEIEPNRFFYGSDLKILKIISKGNVYTVEESVANINRLIEQEVANFSNSTYFPHFPHYSNRDIRKVSAKNSKAIKLEYEEISYSDAEILYLTCERLNDSGSMLVEDDAGKIYALSYTYIYNGKNVKFPNCHLSELAGAYTDMVVLNHPLNKATVTGKNLVKFYRIRKHLKKDSYV